MKVTVDPVSCEANAVCVRLVPQVFSIHEDEEGEDVLAIANDGDVPAEHADGVRDAVTAAPRWPSPSKTDQARASGFTGLGARAPLPGPPLSGGRAPSHTG